MKTKTIQARKQRKRLASRSLHQNHSLLSATLSKELRKRFNRRNLPVRKGDKARVLVGSFKGKEGEVMNIDLGKRKVYIDKVISKKRDGTEVLRAMEPSNIMLIDIDIRDKRRQAILARKVEKSVIDAEVKKEEARLKKEEEERKAKEAEKKKAEEAKKKEKEEKEKAKEGKTEKKSGKTGKKKETKVSEKGINKKTKKDWISEK
jgi:large subunit ribosomal protein L24